MKTILLILLSTISLTNAADLMVAWDPPEEGEVTGYMVYAQRASDPGFQLVKTVLVEELHENAAGSKGAVIDFDKAGVWSVYVVTFYDYVGPSGVARIMGPTPDPENILTFHVPGNAKNLRVSTP